MGYFRLFLACLVMAGHAEWIPIIWAQGSVISFYALAGYTGTASRSRYRSPIAYLVARYRRLWPTYAIVFVVVTVALLLGWAPEPFPRLPGLWPWLKQLVFLDLPLPSVVPFYAWIVPVTWMLPVMMFWWGAISVGLSSSMSITLGWVGVSLAIALSQPSYFSVWFASLPFALGALVWHCGLRVPKDGRLSELATGLSYPLFLVHYPIQKAWPDSHLIPTIGATIILYLVEKNLVSKK